MSDLELVEKEYDYIESMKLNHFLLCVILILANILLIQYNISLPIINFFFTYLIYNYSKYAVEHRETLFKEMLNLYSIRDVRVARFRKKNSI